MFSKYIIPALCASNLFVEAAVNQHRHAHKRDYIATHVEVVTDVVVVTVTEGQLPPPPPATPTPTPSAKPIYAAARPHKGGEVGAEAVPSPPPPAAPVVAPSPSPYSPPPPPPPAPKPTTMITSAKPAPTPEKPPVSIATQAAVVAPAPAANNNNNNNNNSNKGPSAPAPKSKGGKRGLAYNDPKLVANICSSSNKFSWAYNWGSQSDGLEAPLVYYPTLWGPQPIHSQGWSANAHKAIANGADTLFSFNECDNAGQCNMDAASAAAAHKSFMSEFKGKAQILAPSITSSETPGQGIDWLKSFKQACGADCPFDGCNAHWYGPGGKEGAEEFLGHMKKVNEACGKNKVWVTEFAAISGDADAFVKHALQQLDNSPEYDFIEKYSYFYLAPGSLMQSSTALSSFGHIYATI